MSRVATRNVPFMSALWARRADKVRAIRIVSDTAALALIRASILWRCPLIRVFTNPKVATVTCSIKASASELRERDLTAPGRFEQLVPDCVLDFSRLHRLMRLDVTMQFDQRRA